MQKIQRVPIKISRGRLVFESKTTVDPDCQFVWDYCDSTFHIIRRYCNMHVQIKNYKRVVLTVIVCMEAIVVGFTFI